MRMLSRYCWHRTLRYACFSAEQASTHCCPLAACLLIASEIACSHGHLSSSVSGCPERILSASNLWHLVYCSAVRSNSEKMRLLREAAGSPRLDTRTFVALGVKVVCIVEGARWPLRSCKQLPNRPEASSVRRSHSVACRRAWTTAEKVLPSLRKIRSLLNYVFFARTSCRCRTRR